MRKYFYSRKARCYGYQFSVRAGNVTLKRILRDNPVSHSWTQELFTVEKYGAKISHTQFNRFLKFFEHDAGSSWRFNRGSIDSWDVVIEFINQAITPERYNKK
jgi:hypothetical protein